MGVDAGRVVSDADRADSWHSRRALGRRQRRRRAAVIAILDAFRSFRVVSFPGGHTDANESQALLRALVADPRFGATVNDIVVEFGSSRYQDVMDRYIRGEDVPESTVQRAWLDAVQPGISLDNQNTPAFFRAVREANMKRSAVEKTRVLLGDPPIDWEHVRNKADYRKWEIQRDSYPADLSGGSCWRTTGARWSCGRTAT